MASAARYIQDLQARGRTHFTTGEAVRALGMGEAGGSLVAVRAALRRLKEKGLIADPHRGFHVIVSPEYRDLGCLPADQFVPELMAHLAEPYYVGLLSAAALHGAAHQRPQVFQVVVQRARRAIECGRVRIHFTARRDMRATPVVQRNTPRGVLRIASPDATALELVGYVQASGGLDHVATVLRELSEAMDPAALAAEARRAPLAWVQRLGILLVLVEAEPLALALDPILRERPPFTIALSPSLPMVGAPRDARWNVALNCDVVADL